MACAVSCLLDEATLVGSMRDSNRNLRTNLFGRRGGNRTPDHGLIRTMLSPLSYSPFERK